MRLIPLFFSCFSLLLLTNCAPVLLFSAGVATIDIAAQDRGVGGTVSDTQIRADINHEWFNSNIDMYRDVHLSVQNARVLLTGFVPSQEVMDEAVRLSWKATGVKEVINELQIEKEQSFGDSVDDVWISTKIRSTMVLEDGIRSSNYSVTTMGGTVYLLGIAQNQEELDKTLDIAKNTNGVQKVINHVIIKEQEPQSSGMTSTDAQNTDQNKETSSSEASSQEDSLPWESKTSEENSIGVPSGPITEEKLTPPT